MNKLTHLARATIDFLGPVAGAIHGQLSRPEIARAAAKAGVVAVATGASMAATLKNPETLSELVVPLAAAAFTGVLDAVSRLKQGDPSLEPHPPSEPTPCPPLTVPPPSGPHASPCSQDAGWCESSRNSSPACSATDRVETTHDS